MSLSARGDVRRDVEVIRGIVENFDEPTEPELKRLYRAFCGYIEEVNAELEACETLIDANDETQAVQRAERSQLLELVATLESVDREGWDGFLNEKGLKPAPALDLNAASRLNQCFGPVRQREPLMRELRWHALAGSPLRVRLGVMHRIRQADPKPEMWEPDIREFETARIAEIDEELEEACAARDVARLGLLCRELTGNAWLEQPAQETVQRARREFQKGEARRARKRIPRILEELRNAEAGGEDQIAEGRRLMHQLEVHMKKARFPQGARQYELAGEAVEWIIEINEGEQQEANYTFLVGDMEQLMDQFPAMKQRSQRQDARDRLKQIAYKLQNYEEGVPETARVRLNSIYDAVEREDRWAQAFRLTTVACVVAAAGALLWYGLQYRSHNNRLAGHAKRLGLLVEREDFEATDRYVEKLEEQAPDVLEHPPVAALLARHQENVSAEQQRVARLTSGLRDLQNRMADISTLSEASTLSTRLEELESLCRFEKELNDVDGLRRELTARQVSIQEAIDESFTEELTALNNRYGQTDSGDAEGLREILDGYEELNRRPEVSENLKTSLVALQKRIVTRLSLLAEMQKQSQQLSSITASVGSWPRFKAALEQFSRQFPESARGLQMQRVLEEESALWAAIEEQNEFVRKWSLVDFSNVTPQIAAELSELAEEFLNEHTGFKHAETLRKQIPWLKAVAGRENSAGERIIDPLLEVLRDPQVSGLFMVLTEDGKRYYSDEAPKSIGNGAFVIKQFDDSTLSTKTTKTYFLDDLKEPTRLGTSYDWTSPQSLFARQASSSLTRIEHSNWEETMLELIDRLIEDERMDPIIQFQLLDNLLPVALEGSVLLQDVLRRPADDIRRTRLGTNLNLFDPEDVDTDKARREAARFLKNLPDMGDILRGIGRMRADITTPLSATGWRWVAWMYKDSNTRQWVCTAPEPPAAGEQGELYIAVKEGSSPDLVKIGSIQDREYRFTEAAQTGLLLEGRPVFQSVSR